MAPRVSRRIHLIRLTRFERQKLRGISPNSRDASRGSGAFHV
jgi:hypothetical protein